MRDEEGGLGLDLGGLGSGLKRLGGLLALAFAITLAVVVGKQMNTEAMAVVIGVACGVVAAIPTSVLLLVVLSRRERQHAAWEAEKRAAAGQRGYPPVVVIQGGGPGTGWGLGLPSGPQAGYWPTPPPAPPAHRRFHVVGDDQLFLDDGGNAENDGRWR